MKVALVFETDVDESMVGTSNDVLALSIQRLEAALGEADSTDDLGKLFSMEIPLEKE